MRQLCTGLQKMNQTEISASDMKMAASTAFTNILDQVKSANLNFHLQLSPFSAIISLKRSLVKDQSGSHLLPPPTPSDLESENRYLKKKILDLEKETTSLRFRFEETLEDCQNAYKTITNLEHEASRQANQKIKMEKIENDALVDDLKCAKEQIGHLKDDNKKLEKTNRELSKAVSELRNDIKAETEKSKVINNRLNKAMFESSTKHKKEIEAITKDFKIQLKEWRNELGDERKAKIQLEKKLENLKKSTATQPLQQLKPVPLTESSISTSDETLCSLCASAIPNFVPKFFHGEQFSPACENCDDFAWMSDSSSDETSSQTAPIPITPRGFDIRPTSTTSKSSSSSSNCSHTQQCIIRQPFPPPLPALTPLVNEYSLYHSKTMAGELDYGSTCWYCMRIEYEKYGCDSCVWIKCFGELHGYPDIAPHDFKKHL